MPVTQHIVIHLKTDSQSTPSFLDDLPAAGEA